MHIVRESISDAIGILDSAPLRPSVFSPLNLMQIGNRIPVAHLAIEHGLKALIRDKVDQNSANEISTWLADKSQGKIHSLEKLYSKLGEVDEGAAMFLSSAFDDTVKYFGYKPDRKGYKHFRSLHSYLSLVATSDVFKAMRYWVLEGTEEQNNTIALISPPIHREILCALRCLFFPDFRETVSERVVRSLIDARFNRSNPYGYRSVIGERVSNSWSLERLTQENACARHVLETAEKMGEDERALIAILLQACIDGNADTTKSDDHAVLYFFNTLSYLRSGSQPQDPNVVVEEKCLKPDGASREIRTSAGFPLGWVRKLADGAWAVTPNEEGILGDKAIAWKLKDAKSFLVNRLTSKVIVETNGGEAKELRVFSRCHRWPRPKQANHDGSRYVGSSLQPHPDRVIYELQFWDAEHGLKLGDLVTMDLQLGNNNTHNGLSPIQLRGEVTSVDNQFISVDR